MSPDLLILCATLPEISYFLSARPPESKTSTRTGLNIYSGKTGHKKYDLMITGPGVFNTVHALTAYLEGFHPELILQTGIAGVFMGTGLDIGDVAIATEEHYIHTGIAADSPVNAPLPFDLIESSPKTREGRYSFDMNTVQACYDKLFAGTGHLGIKAAKGSFITVSTLTSSLKQADLLYASFSPIMEAMEGAAAAHVAELYGVSMVEIRAASNFVGERDKARWDIQKAAMNLAVACSLI